MKIEHIKDNTDPIEKQDVNGHRHAHEWSSWTQQRLCWQWRARKSRERCLYCSVGCHGARQCRERCVWVHCHRGQCPDFVGCHKRQTGRILHFDRQFHGSTSLLRIVLLSVKIYSSFPAKFHSGSQQRLYGCWPCLRRWRQASSVS